MACRLRKPFSRLTTKGACAFYVSVVDAGGGYAAVKFVLVAQAPTEANKNYSELLLLFFFNQGRFPSLFSRGQFKFWRWQIVGWEVYWQSKAYWDSGEYWPVPEIWFKNTYSGSFSRSSVTILSVVKVAYITVMIFIHIILHSAVHIIWFSYIYNFSCIIVV